MGNNQRKKHSPEFKAKVALEALRESSTLAELSKKYGVSQSQISRWKNEMTQNASADEAHQKEVDRLHRKIGELEMDVDFLERVSRKLGISVPAKR